MRVDKYICEKCKTLFDYAYVLRIPTDDSENNDKHLCFSCSIDYINYNYENFIDWCEE